jgi:hypothetical protein
MEIGRVVVQGQPEHKNLGVDLPCQSAGGVSSRTTIQAGPGKKKKVRLYLKNN